MTTRILLGIPAAAHREALLRETSGGGRAPTRAVDEVIPPCPACGAERKWSPAPTEQSTSHWICSVEWRHDDGYYPRHPRALVLHHSSDPEATAMGLARLAWVCAPLAWSCTDTIRRFAWWRVNMTRRDRFDFPEVRLESYDDARSWKLLDVPAFADLRGERYAAEFVAAVAVHLGVLERYEWVEVP